MISNDLFHFISTHLYPSTVPEAVKKFDSLMPQCHGNATADKKAPKLLQNQGFGGFGSLFTLAKVKLVLNNTV